MSESVETLVDSILLRLRDPNARAHPRALVRDILSRTQVGVNAFRAYVLSDFFLNTIPGKSIYRMDSDVIGLVKVVDVLRDDIYIDEIRPWRNLWKLSPTWQLDAGDVNGWAMIGMTLFAIWPTPKVSQTYRLRGPTLTAELISDMISAPFRSEDQDIAKDLATALLLFRWRDLDMMQELTKRAGERLWEHVGSVMQEEHR